jgi:hypothetical protein
MLGSRPMGYRSGGPCEVCDEAAVADCPRCACHFCERHGPGGGRLCALCLKEMLDDQDVARFRSRVFTPAERGGPYRRDTAPVFEALFGWLGRLLLRAGEKRPAERPFGERTPEEIRAWRLQAGIKTRT